jgi:hypothetical protein
MNSEREAFRETTATEVKSRKFLTSFRLKETFFQNRFTVLRAEAIFAKVLVDGSR